MDGWMNGYMDGYIDEPVYKAKANIGKHTYITPTSGCWEKGCDWEKDLEGLLFEMSDPLYV